MRSWPRAWSSVSASAVRRAHALTLAVPPASGASEVSVAEADGDDDEGVFDGVGVPLVAEPPEVEEGEATSSGVSPPPHPAASTPTRATATAAVRRGRTAVVEREVTPRR
jgi:hypothetical protein